MLLFRLTTKKWSDEIGSICEISKLRANSNNKIKKVNKMVKRNETRKIFVGGVQIGGQNKVVIQSMTNTKTKDVIKTVEQILKLEESGCEIIRVACLDEEDAKAIKEIKKKIHIPIVSDIHFDYRIALEAAKAGVNKIRINPGNIRFNR